MDEQPTKRPVTVWSTGWLAVFAVDASLVGRGDAHRIGALVLLLLFAALVVSELRSSD